MKRRAKRATRASEIPATRGRITIEMGGARVIGSQRAPYGNLKTVWRA